MRRWLLRAGPPVLLLLLAGTGCGAASRDTYHASTPTEQEFRSGYGYGGMFEGDRSGGDYSVATGAVTSSVEPMSPAPEPMADSYGAEESAPVAVAEMAAASEPMGGPGGGGGGSGGIGYDFEDDMVAGDMARPDGEMMMGGRSAPPPAPPPARPELAEARRPVPTPPAPTPEGPAGGEEAPDQVADAGSGGPLLIYEASLNLAVHEVREKMAEVIAIADDVGGFLQRQDDTTVVVRVPAARFREALERVEGVGDVLSRRVSAEDVSEQFRDTRIRLRNALEMRDRMAELLQRADTVPDSLTIQRELERLTQEIELYRGQLRALEDRIAFSTITIMFQPIRVDAEVPRERFRLPFAWLDMLGLPHLMELQ
jgi:hypothetical protein